ncbi:hypothetical protein [Winogradskyella psychrotolerans]|uniref:hypothetical protein n=1 Tax=Winogradskyella psychrotolerans TaxID=1344585 RepID=UPI001C07BB67|nr:hypothetical protein [Winogradskyella psychrotolerans]
MSISNLIPKTTDAIVLSCVTILVLSLFIAGLCDVLDYFIIKVMLFICFGSLFITAIIFAAKNDVKENRLEDTPQDDSH